MSHDYFYTHDNERKFSTKNDNKAEKFPCTIYERHINFGPVLCVNFHHKMKNEKNGMNHCVL